MEYLTVVVGNSTKKPLAYYYRTVPTVPYHHHFFVFNEGRKGDEPPFFWAHQIASNSPSFWGAAGSSS